MFDTKVLDGHQKGERFQAVMNHCEEMMETICKAMGEDYSNAEWVGMYPILPYNDGKICGNYTWGTAGEGGISNYRVLLFTQLLPDGKKKVYQW